MGDEISRWEFSSEDYKEFKNRLRNESRILKGWFENKSFESTDGKCGFELEAWLMNPQFQPSPINETFLDNLADPLVVPELSKFNFELNSIPCSIEGNFLSHLESELSSCWSKCAAQAEKLNSNILAIGILPTIEDKMLTLEHMSSLNRYLALNRQVLHLRQGEPLELKIEGKDSLHARHYDVMLEAVATSLQIHCQVKADKAVRQYNLSQILSAPMVAVAANSPYLFGKDLWDETRIPLFEQSVSVASFPDCHGQNINRVTFGTGYARHSLFEPFLENLDGFPVLLPMVLDDDPAWLSHLRLQNGTIWRWTRPLIGLTSSGNPHLRLEHRTPAAGPSITDTIANIAFFIGMKEHLAERETPLELEIPFDHAKENFYKAAQHGLRAEIKWIGGKSILIQTLLEQTLLPIAKEGLQKSGVHQVDIDYYLGDVIENRIKSRQNGTAWQRGYIAKNGPGFQQMTGAYYENQKRNRPVYQWTI
ncbi:MAG: hypothetical protein G3M70_13245 [Candidatus Nitronauta litoralis]|uniref:Glutamate--cysteine ligase n=1 Tax=Candidatus Nitronauta litoralis TaxID=2705533 RepID=A0A7T0BXK4_9BACT|nr:MAG: hypothetical protein G3M70_13245 [Candidatus Nitronauta litoralis]